eukprot:snap_masked-scaffold_23-processed-gene-5.8-mRNA-1 protein AED:1.00 eAED:1.00 QI:0/-1/0/0/-1/1/1/0/65
MDVVIKLTFKAINAKMKKFILPKNETIYKMNMMTFMDEKKITEYGVVMIVPTIVVTRGSDMWRRK